MAPLVAGPAPVSRPPSDPPDSTLKIALPSNPPDPPVPPNPPPDTLFTSMQLSIYCGMQMLSFYCSMQASFHLFSNGFCNDKVVFRDDLQQVDYRTKMSDV
ncbi:unnamed protein product [Brassica napus]|uniref:(rape) hypothetical protein n=1 Tax=Brassica napus TaxID=3708 RepID=A0A816KQ47_BRANA|nr:unnamed protein product [Brassica napus]